MLGTSVYGGAIMAGSLDYFVEKFLMVKWVWDRVALKPSPAPCWFGWLILAVWPLMVFIGITTQWAVTGRGIHHQEREWAQAGLFGSLYPAVLKLSLLSYKPLSCLKMRFSFQTVLVHSSLGCFYFETLNYKPSIQLQFFLSLTTVCNKKGYKMRMEEDV